MRRDEQGFQCICTDTESTGRRDAWQLLSFARAMQDVGRQVVMPHNGQAVALRVGIHTGPCVTGLVGTRLPKFGVFGDTMNTASRMESTCTPGCIQVSDATFELLGRPEGVFAASGGIEVKGKGEWAKWVGEGECK